MHVRDLVELGALLAAHGCRFVQHSPLLTERHLEQYWLASRCRHDHWYQMMKSFEQAPLEAKRDQWPTMHSIMQEVLASELLTRIWSAIGWCYDKQHDCSVFDPVLRSVLVGHMEARNRVLHTLVKGQGFSVSDGMRLNQLRRHTERWTDMMLGYLAREHNVDDFAFDPEVAREFAADLLDEECSDAEETGWELTLASLRAHYQNSLFEESINPDVNHRIAATILACFHSDLFEWTGTFTSSWMLRMNQVADETECLLEEVLQLERPLSERFSIRR